jgi:hypothetical protein
MIYISFVDLLPEAIPALGWPTAQIAVLALSWSVACAKSAKSARVSWASSSSSGCCSSSA